MIDIIVKIPDLKVYLHLDISPPLNRIYYHPFASMNNLPWDNSPLIIPLLATNRCHRRQQSRMNRVMFENHTRVVQYNIVPLFLLQYLHYLRQPPYLNRIERCIIKNGIHGTRILVKDITNGMTANIIGTKMIGIVVMIGIV